jgi:hypothetical protein
VEKMVVPNARQFAKGQAAKWSALMPAARKSASHPSASSIAKSTTANVASLIANLPATSQHA